MTADEEIRKRVRALEKMGVQQKVMAASIGRRTPWFSNWLNQRPKTAPLNVNELAALRRFAEELARTAMALAEVQIARDMADSTRKEGGAGDRVSDRRVRERP